MRIRNLDADFDGCSLEIYRGGCGDVFVTIRDEPSEKNPSPGFGKTVRVGMCGSGASIPPSITALFAELAAEFEKYKDCEYETDAYMKYERNGYGKNANQGR